MTGAYFTPKRADGRSGGRVLLDYLAGRIQGGTLQVGDVVSHAELSAELGTPQDSAYYSAVGSAIRKLEREHARSLRTVRGQGYQLVEGKAMLDLGRGHQARGRRNIRRGAEVVKAIDTTALAPAERTMVEQVIRGMSNLAALVSMQAERLADHDQQIRLLQSARITDAARARATAADVEDLRRRMDKIEEQGQ